MNGISTRRGLLWLVSVWAATCTAPRGAKAFSHTPPTMALSQLRFNEAGTCVFPPYFRDEKTQNTFTLRNVPGDGDCMFLAVMQAALISMGLLNSGMPSPEGMARDTRKAVSNVLQSPGSLVVDDGQPPVSTKRLLATVVAQEGCSPEEYIEKLETIGKFGGIYGGGPELVVLSNLLRRPISIYEFPKTETVMRLEKDCAIVQRQGTFGSFGDALPGDSAIGTSFSWHLHILVINTSPEEKHACILLPCDVPKHY